MQKVIAMKRGGRIVDSARRLFNRHGFDNVSLDGIMAGAGLTRGGFYSYFESKSDLYAEVLGCFFTDPEWKNCWEGVEVDLKSADVAPQVIRAYLSRQHYEDVENSCPMVALPTDVSRSSRRPSEHLRRCLRDGECTGAKFTQETSAMGARWPRRVAALCVGGMVVARAMENRSSADALRDACMTVWHSNWVAGIAKQEATKRRARKVGRRKKQLAGVS